jgi:hypothetical protein
MFLYVLDDILLILEILLQKPSGKKYEEKSTLVGKGL